MGFGRGCGGRRTVWAIEMVRGREMCDYLGGSQFEGGE